MHHDVDINYGVDFERALERLNHAAGKIFRQYWAAKHGNAGEAEVERLRQAYTEAQREVKALSSRDEAAIRAVLANQQAEQTTASTERSIRLVLAGELRDDGEPMTGYDEVDNDNAAPSNVTFRQPSPKKA